MPVELVNTRVDDGNTSYSDAIINGLGAEQGLFTPETIEPFTRQDLARFGELNYPEMAFRILHHFNDLPMHVTHGIVREAYSTETFRRQGHAPDEVVPYVNITDGIGIVELYHGPTYAFKDVALQVTPREMDHVLGKRGKHLTIAGATSGDTGSAAMDGVLATDHMDIVMLSPPNMADVQKGQMGQRAAIGENVLNLMVDGATFDDCQTLVKDLNGEPGFEDLGALNSINWGRIVAQVPYYFSAYYQMVRQQGLEIGDPVDFVVPSGNFGNALSGHVARKLGLPIRNIIIATNENDVLHEAVQTGNYKVRPSHEVIPTESPSMDIASASNFERLLFWMFDGDRDKVVEFLRLAKTEGANIGEYVSNGNQMALRDDYGFDSTSATQAERRLAMGIAYEDSGVMVDPHTANGIFAAYKRLSQDRNAGVPQIVMATASIHKFRDDVKEAYDDDLPPMPADLEDALLYVDNFEHVPHDLDEIKTVVGAFRNRK